MDNGVHILIVDDDPTAQTILRINLELSGYRVSVVADGDAALAHVALGGVALVLLDLILPGTSGIETLSRLCDLKGPPVIAVSSHAGDDLMAESLRLGADDFIAKPVLAGVLIKRVEAVLARQRQRDHALGEIAAVRADPTATRPGRDERPGRANFPDTTGRGVRLAG